MRTPRRELLGARRGSAPAIPGQVGLEELEDGVLGRRQAGLATGRSMWHIHREELDRGRLARLAARCAADRDVVGLSAYGSGGMEDSAQGGELEERVEGHVVVCARVLLNAAAAGCAAESAECGCVAKISSGPSILFAARCGRCERGLRGSGREAGTIF